jgi:histidyl-tRNA synthetase
MRILDCKVKHCQELGKDAPVILDYLCDDCKEHFEKLQEYLSVMGIDFDINPKIVRGLDYYTRTVFEFITDEIVSSGLLLVIAQTLYFLSSSTQILRKMTLPAIFC